MEVARLKALTKVTELFYNIGLVASIRPEDK